MENKVWRELMPIASTWCQRVAVGAVALPLLAIDKVGLGLAFDRMCTRYERWLKRMGINKR